MIGKVPKKENLSVNVSHALVSFDFLMFEAGTARLSQDINKKLPLCAA